jgi:hypothetical protein
VPLRRNCSARLQESSHNAAWFRKPWHSICFPAFFPILLIALGLVSSSLRAERGQKLAVRLSEILPPGGEVDAWQWVLLGWLGTLLVGSLVMKLIMQGIQLIYGDHERHSFLGRQLRGLILFAVSVVAWLVAIALSVFGGPVRQWMIRGFGKSPMVRGNDLEFGSSRSGSGDDSVVGCQFAVWNLRPKGTVRTRLRWSGGGDRLDGVDGVLCDDRLSWCGLECGKSCTIRLSFAEHPRKVKTYADPDFAPITWRAAGKSQRPSSRQRCVRLLAGD